MKKCSCLHSPLLYRDKYIEIGTIYDSETFTCMVLHAFTVSYRILESHYLQWNPPSSLSCHLFSWNETQALEDCRNDNAQSWDPGWCLLLAGTGCCCWLYFRLVWLPRLSLKKQMDPTYATKPSLVIFADRKEWMMKTIGFGQEWRSSCWKYRKKKSTWELQLKQEIIYWVLKLLSGILDRLPLTATLLYTILFFLCIQLQIFRLLKLTSILEASEILVPLALYPPGWAAENWVRCCKHFSKRLNPIFIGCFCLAWWDCSVWCSVPLLLVQLKYLQPVLHSCFSVLTASSKTPLRLCFPQSWFR